MRLLGAHVSTAGGLSNAIKNGQELGINTIQIHPTAPQRWATKLPSSEDIKNFVLAQKESDIKMLFAHAIYLINLAQPEKQKFHLSKMSLVTYLDLFKEITHIAKEEDADIQTGGVVVHPGSGIHYPTEKEALDRCVYGINWILENATFGTLLLEASAGAGQVIGDQLEELATLRDGSEQKDRVKFCLDTQHMFVSGYNWTDKLEGIITQIEQTIGLENVALVHLNDSKTPHASKKDRHENLGEGLIGEETIKKIINHPKLKNIPMVMETPNLKDIETAKTEVAKLKEWATG
jgi:deoxyribonuclease-4